MAPHGLEFPVHAGMNRGKPLAIRLKAIEFPVHAGMNRQIDEADAADRVSSPYTRG